MTILQAVYMAVGSNFRPLETTAFTMSSGGEVVLDAADRMELISKQGGRLKLKVIAGRHKNVEIVLPEEDTRLLTRVK